MADTNFPDEWLARSLEGVLSPVLLVELLTKAQPGQTLWDVAARASDGGDVRATMAHLEAINHLDSTALQVGQHLRVPK